jgi:farnesol dehydrogenase
VKEGSDIVIVNPTRVFGPGPLVKSNSVTKIIHKYINGKWRFQPGTGNEIGNYAFVEDVISGHILAMEKGKAGERYILGGENASYLQFINSIAEVHGKKYSLIKIPLGFFTIYGSFSDWLASTFSIEPMITKNWVKKYKENWIVSSEKAQREIDYKITPMKSAISQTIEWLNQNDYRT